MKFRSFFTKPSFLFVLLLLSATTGFAQVKFNGRIVAGKDKLPVAGATISVKGNTTASENSTTTNQDGLFSIELPRLPSSLRISYVGYQPQEFRVTSSSSSLQIIELRNSGNDLGEIVVTAGRSKQRLEDVPQKIEVITRKDIALTPALDVTDIVKKSAAVNVIQYPGILSGVGFRGFRPQFSGLTQHTLLLINGRPAGTTNLGTIDLNNIDRIEVLKGPASALYGSQAMGGVLNIITPQSSGNLAGNVFADYGSFNTSQFGGKAGGSINSKLDFDLSGTYFNRNSDFKMGDGNLFRKMLGSSSATNYYTNGTTKVVDDSRGDGQTRPNTRYRYYTGSGRIGYKIDTNWRVDLSGTIFRANHVESPGDIFSGEGGAGLKDIKRNSGEAAVTGKIGNNELSARAYYAEEQSTTYAVRTTAGLLIDNPYLSGNTNYQWSGLQLRDALSLGKNQRLIFGYDYNNAASKTKSYTAPAAGIQKETASAPNASIVTNGWYMQGQFSLLNDRLKVNPGVRFDLTDFELKSTPDYTRTLVTGTQNNVFLSPSVSAQYNLFDAFAVHGSIGRAFVTPDALQIAGYQVSGTGSGKVTVSQGNPDLKNESSLSEEIGLKYNRPKAGLMADVTYFTTSVKDRITSISAPPSPAYSIGTDAVTAVTNYFNSNKSRIRGLEFMLSYDFGALADFHYSLRAFTNITRNIKAQDITVSPTGIEAAADIQNIAKSIINYGIEYGNNKNYSIRLTGRYVGKRWDTDFNDALRPLVNYSSFMTADLAGSYNFTSHHQLTLTVANLTDENYYEKRGYSQSGRNFRLRYTYSFGSLFSKK